MIWLKYENIEVRFTPAEFKALHEVLNVGVNTIGGYDGPTPEMRQAVRMFDAFASVAPKA